ncbi:type II CRISPR RNA-guided endonuclease Cas9 [Arcanobacterium bovis]|uniref:HNH endonuclease n=1 Tax=Arcanobacterium bovis TaxID=2529275 RepID=A0A4Q9UYW5_9ACTO|nr:type II CRISPR RNA-guided endonuclease Cas9 [Arcanobacterium bovis]TBW20918.1 HNH endonuclease [Arcanobacterium bovis]
MKTMNYNVGVDVGTNSVGLCALEIGENGLPTRILNSVVYVHDSGVDPEQRKKAITRLATSGVARRTRRLYRRRKQRLRALDDFLTAKGYPIINLEEIADPHAPWHIRAKLAREELPADEFPSALSITLRHMARHRGWRSPYASVKSLHLPAADSEEFKKLKERLTEYNGVMPDEDATPAEIIADMIADYTKVRGEGGILGGKLRQSDNANELRKIAAKQGISTEDINDIIDVVFDAKSPVGSAASRTGKDELPGQHHLPRAEKAHPAFQKYRIVSVVANLRIREDAGTTRSLTKDERLKVVEFLMEASSDDAVTWTDVAELLGVVRDNLEGTAKEGPDGERPYAKPPVNVTNQRIVKAKPKALSLWWQDASEDERAALIALMSNADILEDDADGAEAAQSFLAGLSDKELEELSGVDLPAGRAAYSVDSLTRLTNRMLNEGIDLHEARKAEFGVDDSWKPSADPIGLPVGNPGVDRVLKIVNRWLTSAIKEFGYPNVVNIEHMRDGFVSEKMAREYERENGKRAERNRNIVEQIHADQGSGRVRKSDITRYLAVKRQNCQCAYCGAQISMNDCEMDHIVPRKGVGSTNTRNNLAAVCISCNRSKGNIPFRVWAQQNPNPEITLAKAVDRVKHWHYEEGLSTKQWNNFKKDVIDRLSRTSEDPELDNRSMESVAWMANELRHRIEYFLKQENPNSKVGVYQGKITAQARKASGFEDRVEMIGGGGKTRLDRRHHAMDAATIALMSPGISKTLAERINLRDTERMLRKAETWKEYRGRFDGAKQSFGEWINKMDRLSFLFNDALATDSIPVMENLRLGLGNGRAHDDSIRKLTYKEVGSAWTTTEIDRASSEALWCALTRCEDFDAKTGLPENDTRQIRVKNEYFTAKDTVGIFGTGAAAIAVRGGYAEIGNTIHHARVYRINGKKPVFAMVRVFMCDLISHRGEDLFNVELKPQSISIRAAEPKIRKALADGTAEYLGWLVAGDEMVIDISNPKLISGQIKEMLDDFPGQNRFRVAGFYSNARLRLRPAMLSAEGLKDQHCESSYKIIDGGGWFPAINVICQYGSPHVIRRSALGVPRTHSKHGLPESWHA